MVHPLAALARRRRARRMMRRLRELDRLDASYGVGALPTSRPPRRDWRLGAAMVAGLGSFIGLLVWATVNGGGFGADAPEVRDGGGSFAFLYTKRDGTSPAGWDPCRTIEVEINPAGAPPGHEQLVRTAMAHVSAESGLRFELIGTTDSRRFLNDRGGYGRQPAIVGWSNGREFDELDGDVAGVAGPTVVDIGGDMFFVSGAVVLDSEAFDEILEAGLDEEAQAIVDHEFGHLVGLDHVKDRGELMYASNVGQTTWGPGDREALARLGNVRCQ